MVAQSPALLSEAPELLTVAEVCAIVRLGKSVVHRMCDDGRLPCVRIGRNRRIPRSKLQAMIGAGGGTFHHQNTT